MSLDNDEALARALQEEYEREYRRNQRQQQQPRPPPRNPSLSESSRQPPQQSGSRHRRSRSQTRTASSSHSRSRSRSARSHSRSRVDRNIVQQQQSILTSATTTAASAPTMPPSAQDERARLEQEQRDYELARRMGSRHWTENGSASRTAAPDPALQRSNSNAYPATTAAMPEPVQDADAAYALRLEQELRDEEVARRMMQSSIQQHRSLQRQSETPRTTSITSSQDDEEYARRVEQELRDEDVARRLRAKEQEQLDRRRATSMTATRQRCTPRSLCGFLIPVLLLGGLIAFLVYWFVFGGGQDIPDFFLPDFEDFAKEDPFNATSPDEADAWANSGRGLPLEIINALDSEWYDSFNRAVSEWDNGSPDTLELTVSTQPPDEDCRSVPGKLKVCNGDYGGTNWRGINQIALNGREIVSSVALMNEFYLNRASSSQRQYTMCHEIGHGFGLPHTDENFYNSDSGECMDYTTNPANNESPGPANFIFLRELYGEVPGSSNTQNDVVNDVSTYQQDLDNMEEQRGGAGQGNQGNRRRRNGNRRATETADNVGQPRLHPTSKYFIPWNEITADHSSGKAEERGWRLLHRSRHGEAHEKDVGDGHVVRVHKLLAPDSGLRG